MQTLPRRACARPLRVKMILPALTEAKSPFFRRTRLRVAAPGTRFWRRIHALKRKRFMKKVYGTNRASSPRA